MLLYRYSVAGKSKFFFFSFFKRSKFFDVDLINFTLTPPLAKAVTSFLYCSVIIYKIGVI